MQVIGAIIAAAVLYGIASGQAGWQPGGFASNGFGDLSPGKYSMMAVLLCEVVMTAMFLFVIMGATDSRAPAGFAPIAIGLCLTVIHLVSIPVSNTSVNPARSTAVALFAQTGALSQLWLFWLAPLIGGVIGGVVYKVVAGTPSAPDAPAAGARPGRLRVGNGESKGPPAPSVFALAAIKK